MIRIKAESVKEKTEKQCRKSHKAKPCFFEKGKQLVNS